MEYQTLCVELPGDSYRVTFPQVSTVEVQHWNGNRWSTTISYSNTTLPVWNHYIRKPSDRSTSTYRERIHSFQYFNKKFCRRYSSGFCSFGRFVIQRVVTFRESTISSFPSSSSSLLSISTKRLKRTTSAMFRRTFWTWWKLIRTGVHLNYSTEYRTTTRLHSLVYR